MDIQQIIEKRAELTGGVFRVAKGLNGWEFRDLSGSLPFDLNMVENEDGLPYFPKEGQVVDAAAIIRYDKKGNVNRLVARLFPVASKVTALMTLDHKKLPNPNQVIELERLIQGLTIAQLRNFCIELFSDEELALRYVTAKASWKYHHSEAGGLLSHSLEMAKKALHNELPMTLGTIAREIVAVASLVHDIGKVKSYDKSARLISGRHHEMVGMALISEPLHTLEKEWTEGAGALVAVLGECAYSKNRYGNEMSMALAFLDRASALTDAKKRVIPGRIWEQNSGTYFWNTPDNPAKH